MQINESYFLLDAGLKYPNTVLYGIDSMIADYYKLQDIKDQIKGVFYHQLLKPIWVPCLT
ncbi:hypothetical protein ACEW7V_00795 [Areca yellow leaf disease phytoplasma]|uniref:hypothetical protein n=1 Tax=Areca yellow leaf disease phytoplasma TaxID=927614 RepID=UPI0035B5548D